MNGVPQGRSHTFSNAQGNQTPTVLNSFFVYVVSDYQLVTITNLLMEQTKTNAGAFVDEAKLQLDGGYRNEGNNIAFELFGDGTGTRGFIGAGASNPSGSTYVIPLSNAQQIVQFELGMTLLNYAVTLNGQSITAISAISASTATIIAVDRGLGIITVLASAVDASWTTAGNGLGVQGDVVAGTVNTGASLALTGFQGWLPYTAPASGDSFWGVNRSQDVTRLGGLRFNAQPFTIEEGITQALAFGNREGAKFDLIVMDFASYSALVNQLGAKVSYVQIDHEEVEVAFEGITFQSAYGRVTILADRSCPPATAYALNLKTWKLRSLGKMPHILTYGKLPCPLTGDC